MAARLAPHDPSPLSNLSSVKFELGQYSAASQYILKSLELTERLEPEEDRIRKKKTLYERLVKCYVHDCRFDEARRVLAEVSDETLKNSVRGTLDATAQRAPSRDAEDAKATREEVIDRIPRFRAWLYVLLLFLSIKARLLWLTIFLGMTSLSTTQSVMTLPRPWLTGKCCQT